MHAARQTIVIATLFYAILLSAPAVSQQPTKSQSHSPPQLLIDNGPSHIELQGDVSSIAHEAILRQVILRRFPEKTTLIDVRIRPALPPGWALNSELTLNALAETHTGHAEIAADEITVNGFTSDSYRWLQSVSRLRSNLRPGIVLRQTVEETPESVSLPAMCENVLDAALRDHRIGFKTGSDQLSTSAYPLLDELIQITTDCPGSRVSITGHTDSRGNESANVALSATRAAAVGSYMIERGIDPARIAANGVGSSQPLVDETNARARRKNRRIEVELVFPAADQR